jgi:protein O-GlcNAc transferase
MVSVFSFCLYGPYNARYYPGMLENIYLAGKYFPNWKVYIYVAPDVDESMINHLKACSSVELRYTEETGPINMIHRFYAIDEPGVDIMMVRDADSRIHWKDRWAINEFVKSSELAHTIRDNIVHTSKMMGGLWGIKKAAGVNIHEEYRIFKENPNEQHGMGHDQNFLTDRIYPKVRSFLLVHYSNGRYLPGEKAVEFPFEWINDIYCGRIESNYIERPQPPEKRRTFLPETFIRVRDANFLPKK